ncbi:hypothetical protein JOC70_002375 [Clostridium pascui]|uniref:hypothetical protein n=1 Tax=Clostridium pascui TaxID=46609 RepID=UPI001959DE58|nr:hypothetical protein [Clostridium pascui]MBM7870881.1 hypothetical protein [Clostridium pascui]
MKKITAICTALLLSLSMIGCTAKQQVGLSSDVSKETSDISQKTKLAEKEEKNTVNEYTKLIGLTRDEIIKKLDEKPKLVDEGGLEFPSVGIRVWFGEDAKIVNQVFMNSKDIDFNGTRVGENVEKFKSIFGKPVLEDKESAYINFDYKGLVLHVPYDSKTQKVIAVYLMKEWK